jgi:hypothetical protein
VWAECGDPLTRSFLRPTAGLTYLVTLGLRFSGRATWAREETGKVGFDSPVGIYWHNPHYRP